MAILNGRLVNTIAGATGVDDEWQDVESDEWQDVPTPKKSTRKEGPGALRSLALGTAQGSTFGFVDEAAGGLADLLGVGGERIRAGAAAPPELRAQADAAPSLGDRLKSRMRQEARQASDAHPETYIPGEVAGNVASTYLGGKALGILGEAVPAAGKGLQVLATWAKANPWKAVALAGAGQGGAFGAGASEAEDAEGVALDTLLGTALGAGTSVLGHAGGKVVGKGIQRLRGTAQMGVEKATGEIGELADKAINAEDASGLSAAGRAAQDAYKQAEHTLSLAPGKTTPEKVALAKALLEERALKAAGKLEVSSAAKEAAAEHLSGLAENRASRKTAAVAQEGSPWNQVKPRLKRYALPLAGGAIGYAVDRDSPVGAGLGLGAGLLTGRGLSPTVQALTRMVKHPSVRRAAWTLLGGGARAAEAAGPVAEAIRGPMSRAVQLEFDDPLIQALAQLRGDGDEADPEALAEALRSGR